MTICCIIVVRWIFIKPRNSMSKKELQSVYLIIEACSALYEYIVTMQHTCITLFLYGLLFYCILSYVLSIFFIYFTIPNGNHMLITNQNLKVLNTRLGSPYSISMTFHFRDCSAAAGNSAEFHSFRPDVRYLPLSLFYNFNLRWIS